LADAAAKERNLLGCCKLPRKGIFLAVQSRQVKKFSWLSMVAKQRIFLGCRRQPRERVYLAVEGSQRKEFTWQSTAAKQINFLGGCTLSLAH